MKPYSFIILLGLVGCSGCHSTTTASKPLSIDKKIDACNVVYDHILNLTFDQTIDPEHKYYAGDKRNWGLKLLDQQFVESKSSQRFFAFCINRMSDEQIDCARNASTVQDIDNCNQLIK